MVPQPSPSAPTAATPDAPRTARPHAIRRVLGFAWPHRRLVVLSIALIMFQAAASNARLLLLYPIMTRVFGVDDSAKLTGADAAGDADRTSIDGVLKVAKTKAGRALALFDQGIDACNAITRDWVPETWLEKNLKGEMTPVQRAYALDIQRDKFATLWTVLILFFVFLVVMSLAAYFEDYVNEMMRLRILMDVRRDLCSKLLHQPMSFFDGAHRGDVVQRVLDDVNGFAGGLKLVLGSLPEGVFNLAFGLVMLAALSGELTIVCVAGLLAFIPLRRYTKKVRKQSKQRQTGSAHRVEVLLQIVSGIRTVKAFRSEERKVAEFREADHEVYRRSLKVQRTKSASDALSEFLNNFLVMLLSVGGSFAVLRSLLPLKPTALLLFLVQLANLYKPAKRLVKDVNGMNDAMASVDRVYEILDLPPPPPDPAGAAPFEGVRDAVRFEAVGFSYAQGVPVVHDVTFEIARGATVALVGPSGAGKSTICDLLMRFYDPTQGRITIDGRPLASLARASFLDGTAVVTQDPFLFHTSIGENIRQGRPTATDAQVEAAARAASIHDFIASLPDGYATQVGERGARLSGGQRQRITIARALLRDPQLLVLDEATASLDAASEGAVQEALNRLRAGRTTLVVAHRLSTVKAADCIVVLEHGRIVDRGTHEELLARGGLYASLCAMQNLGADPVGAAAAAATEGAADPDASDAAGAPA